MVEQEKAFSGRYTAACVTHITDELGLPCLQIEMFYYDENGKQQKEVTKCL